MTAYRSWPAPARSMAVAIDTAVTAAQAGVAEAFGDATVELRRHDRGQLIALLGAVTRDLLEQAHPDGLDSDDAEQVLESCRRSAGAWYPDVDRDSLIRALTGALGVSEPEESSGDEAAVMHHGLLLIADRLSVTNRTLPALLDAALAELMREQIVELP